MNKHDKWIERISWYIGIFSGVIGILTFFSATPPLEPPADASSEPSATAVLTTDHAMLIFWFWFAWLMVSITLFSRRYRDKIDHDDQAGNRARDYELDIVRQRNRFMLYKAVAIPGIVITVLTVPAALNLAGRTNELNEERYIEEAPAEATRIAKLILTPTVSVAEGTPTPRPIKPMTTQEVVNNRKANTIAAFIIGNLVLLIVAGILVWLLLNYALPFIFLDLEFD